MIVWPSSVLPDHVNGTTVLHGLPMSFCHKQILLHCNRSYRVQEACLKERLWQTKLEPICTADFIADMVVRFCRSSVISFGFYTVSWSWACGNTTVWWSAITSPSSLLNSVDIWFQTARSVTTDTSYDASYYETDPCAAVTSNVNETRTLKTETKGPRLRPGPRCKSMTGRQNQDWSCLDHRRNWHSSARLLPSVPSAVNKPTWLQHLTLCCMHLPRVLSVADCVCSRTNSKTGFRLLLPVSHYYHLSSIVAKSSKIGPQFLDPISVVWRTHKCLWQFVTMIYCRPSSKVRSSSLISSACAKPGNEEFLDGGWKLRYCFSF